MSYINQHAEELLSQDWQWWEDLAHDVYYLNKLWKRRLQKQASRMKKPKRRESRKRTKQWKRRELRAWTFENKDLLATGLKDKPNSNPLQQNCRSCASATNQTMEEERTESMNFWEQRSFGHGTQRQPNSTPLQWNCRSWASATWESTITQVL
jgi:hypothetical protein